MSHGPPPAPPRLAVWLLERTVPRSARDGVIGDLLEEYHERQLQDATAARSWLWSQAFRMGGRYSWLRLSSRLARLTGRPGWSRPVGSASRIRGVWPELRLVLRRLTHEPVFTLTAIITLGLGVGASTAVFSVVDQVLLRPFPYADPSRLVILWNRMTERDLERGAFAGPDVRFLQQNITTLSGVFGTFATSTNLTGEGEPVEVVLSWVTPNFFEVMGVEPPVGRGFQPADQVLIDPSVFEGQAVPQAPLPTVLSDAMWRGRYGADPNVIGRTLAVNGQQFRVMGVAPRGFRLHMPPERAIFTEVDLWTLWPFPLEDMATGPGGSMVVLGRLAPGADRDAAQAELDRLSAERRNASPGHAAVGFAIEATPLVGETVRHVARPLAWLFAAVTLVLLVAAINVAGLFLARGSSREMELALRIALGGSRWHLLRHGALDALVVATAGTVLGVVLAALALEVIRTAGPVTVPRLDQLSLDLRALYFGALLTGVLTIMVGLIPVIQVSHTSPGDTLAGRSSGKTPRRSSSRRLLVVLEVVASVLLLVGAGTVLKGFIRLVDADPGFRSESVLALRLALPFFAYPEATGRADFFSRLADSLRATPGVEQAGGVSPIPFGGPAQVARAPYAREGRMDQWTKTNALYRPVMPGYHASVEIPLLAGRTFRNDDNLAEAEPVVVVDRTFSEAVWPEMSAVGQRLWVVGPHFGLLAGEPVLAEVIGVVGHVRYDDPVRDSPETIYVPHRFWSSELMDFTLRLDGDPATIAESVRQTVARVDPDLPIRDSRPLADYLASAKAPTKFVLTILAVFAGSALLLATVGLYGMLAYSVKQRAHELGVRVALGARPPQLVRMVLRDGVGLAMVGVAIGLVLAYGIVSFATPALGQMAEAAVFAAIALLVLTVAAAASTVPAHRATQVDPVAALKGE